LKLRAALDVFPIDVLGRTALDLGAAAGGFTRALLAAGARLVYAVDVGYGQLRGSLRQDERVVDLEGVNLASLTARQIPSRSTSSRSTCRTSRSARPWRN
jgi:23S rRNA (cytidine1920-2'-O)/16S rRNA (cytidine1409-2'-O)-methyltransferase